MYLLDTNFCSRVILGDATAISRLKGIDAAELATLSIVRGELIYMAEKSEQRARNLTFVHAFLQRFHSYPVDNDTGDIYGRLKAELMRRFGPREKSKRIKTAIQQLGFTDNDLWIAATAIQHGLTVVSADTDFQRMNEVHSFPVEAW